MSKYGRVAVLAAEKARNGLNPIKAWEDSAFKVFPTQSASRDKGCPRCVFLGLAEEGLIRGVPGGKYMNRESKNKQYAIEGVNLLRKYPELSDHPKKMWEQVMSGRRNQHNEQMFVVAALWSAQEIE